MSPKWIGGATPEGPSLYFANAPRSKVAPKVHLLDPMSLDTLPYLPLKQIADYLPFVWYCSLCTANG